MIRSTKTTLSCPSLKFSNCSKHPVLYCNYRSQVSLRDSHIYCVDPQIRTLWIDNNHTCLTQTTQTGRKLREGKEERRREEKKEKKVEPNVIIQNLTSQRKTNNIISMIFTKKKLYIYVYQSKFNNQSIIISLESYNNLSSQFPIVNTN